MDFPSNRAFRQRRHFLQRSNFSRRRRNYLRFVFIVGLFLVFYFFFPRLGLLEVRKVICQDESSASVAAPYWCLLLQSEFLNRNFFFLDFAGAEKRFKNNFPEFARLSLQRDFPSTVKGRVQEREPLAFVVSSGSSFEATPSAEALMAAGAYLVDGEGYLFKRTSFLQADLPYLYYSGERALGQLPQLSGDFWRFSLKILFGLKKLGLRITAVRQNGGNLLAVSTDDGLALYLSPAEEAEKELTTLQLIIEKYRIEGKRLKKIDLRFREPVVAY